MELSIDLNLINVNYMYNNMLLKLKITNYQLQWNVLQFSYLDWNYLMFLFKSFTKKMLKVLSLWQAIFLSALIVIISFKFTQALPSRFSFTLPVVRGVISPLLVVFHLKKKWLVLFLGQGLFLTGIIIIKVFC